MARKRMIDPKIWDSKDFSRLSTPAKLIFIGLFSQADDDGRGNAEATYVKSKLFPYDEQVRVTDIEKSLNEIAAYMSITFYRHGTDEFYSLDNWSDWQKVDRPQCSKIQPFDDTCEQIRRIIDESSANVPAKPCPNRIEQNRKEYIVRFDRFWSAYPRKDKKQDSLKIFVRLKPDDILLQKMLAAIERQKQTEQWQDRKYIPMPSTWLNGKRWEDDVQEESEPLKKIQGGFQL